MNYNALPYALAAILLGAVGIWFGDFAMQWQGVPKAIPAMPWAYVSGGILVAGGALILARQEKAGALILAAFYGLWVVAFHIPSTVMNAIGSIGAWNAPAESGFVTAGGLALLAAHAGGARDKLALAARLLAGASALVFGFAHFNYIDFTASMVPGWIPFKTFWAWATGAGHLLTGLALLTGFRARLAATCEAAMMGSFVLLLHLPRVVAAPDQHAEWIMLAMSSALAGAALLVRKYATMEP
jgi:uncharacterized membrane protein YphA (DoxX/SURF4 family)